jgi:hypothetical protein
MVGVLFTVSSMRSRRYPTDLTDAEWGRPTTTVPRAAWPTTKAFRQGGSRRHHLLRRQRRLRLSAIAPRLSYTRGTAYYRFRRWRLDGLWQHILVALRRATRQKEGWDPEASAAIVDGQSVRTAEESGSNKGYDAARCARAVNGTCSWTLPGCSSPRG